MPDCMCGACPADEDADVGRMEGEDGGRQEGLTDWSGGAGWHATAEEWADEEECDGEEDEEEWDEGEDQDSEEEWASGTARESMAEERRRRLRLRRRLVRRSLTGEMAIGRGRRKATRFATRGWLITARVSRRLPLPPRRVLRGRCGRGGAGGSCGGVGISARERRLLGQWAAACYRRGLATSGARAQARARARGSQARQAQAGGGLVCR